ncbi:MAG: hypothetical protein ACC652_00265 [Acidimicrobiales bacterium]
MTELDNPINQNKGLVIEWAFDAYQIDSIVDLGGCWGVNGGYTFHALRLGDMRRAVLVDGRITDLTRQRALEFPQLELVEAALGSRETVEQVGKVDAAIMYDILLHQVDPDWAEFLARYSELVDTLIIHNQGWLGPETVRFPDFGVDEYIERVYHPSEESVREWYEQHDEMHPGQNKPWRDVHNHWQWGITAKDLVSTLWDLGYRIDFFHNHGHFDPRFEEIEVLSIIARKRDLP